MKSYNHKPNTNSFVNNHKISNTNGFLPYSLKFISTCIKTASSGVRSASASVAASISSGAGHEHKDQVLWCSFDTIELGPASLKHVLLLGYSNGFQVLDVEDASNVSELVSKRDDPVTFLQMQPLPAKLKGCEGFRASHPLLLVVASDESKSSSVAQNGRDGLSRDASETQIGNLVLSSTAVRFYSLRSHNYVHVLRFRSTVHMVRCSPHIVAIGLTAQIYCFDALTLENKFSVLTYPMPQLGGQGCSGVNIGYGPMDVGARWLAYAPNNPLSSNTGRLSPKSLTPSPGVSPSTSPSNGSLMARYAMESSKQLASGLINLSDMGYKTLSRYYQEFIPDGANSPIPSNSSWKGVRAQTHSTETDTAGMVVVKDFVSRAVISQFKAHSSPISTLCFDPSGTLLLTASVHGNNINIFRIMPRCSKPGSSQNYDWSSSHVHLYKLHRGVTSAVIHDICFSHYSQWVAVITAKGTCHIFLLSPFGGDSALQIHNSDVGQPMLLPVLSLPWWSTPSFMTNQQSSSSQFMPPPPVTSYVTSRIKNSNSGWLNSVSNVASSANGKISAPSGAAAAVFHSLGLHNPQSSLAKANPLEHLLVYTSTGHIVQYELLPSMGIESSTNVSRTVLTSPAQVQDEDLRVKVEPLQWWDVCRRADWPEREECVSGLTFDKDTSDAVMVGSGSEENDAGDREAGASSDRSYFCIANAEVQTSFCRAPLWLQSKISFYTINSLIPDEVALADGGTSGELEIENFFVNEVEIRRKDLLPVFNHFQKNRVNRSERGDTEGKCTPFVSDMAREKSSGDGMIAYPQLDSSFQNSNGSLESYNSPITWSGNETNNQPRGDVDSRSPILEQTSSSPFVCTKQQQQGAYSSPIGAFNVPNRPLTYLTSSPHNADRTTIDKLEPSDSIGGSSSNITEEHIVHDSLDFEHYFQEGYCQPPPNANGSQDPVEEANVDTDENNSPSQDKSEEDDENDDMLGGVFDFSEEG